ncbi:MAG: hypothetical protein ACFFD2_12770 [Promethearchaeota archaeon]
MSVLRIFGGIIAIIGGGLVLLSLVFVPLYTASYEYGLPSSYLNIGLGIGAIAGGVLALAGRGKAGGEIVIAIGAIYIVLGIVVLIEPSLSSEILPYGWLAWIIGLPINSFLYIITIESMIILLAGIFLIISSKME